MLRAANVTIFRGSETLQVWPFTCKPADPVLYYYEPAGYTGDVLYSPGYVLLADCCAAARAEIPQASEPLPYEEQAALTGWEMLAAEELALA